METQNTSTENRPPSYANRIWVKAPTRESRANFAAVILCAVLLGNVILLVSVPVTLGLSSGLLFGFLLAQIGFLSGMIAMGSGNFLWRAGLWYFIAFSWSIPFFIAALILANETFPREPYRALGYFCFVPGVLLAFQLPLWIFRFFSSWRIVADCDEPETPFGVVDFFSAAILVAVAVGGFELGAKLLEVPRDSQLFLATVTVCISVVVCCVLILPSLGWFLDIRHDRPRLGMFAIWSIFFSMLSLMIGSVLVTTLSSAPVPGIFEVVPFVLVVAVPTWIGFFFTFWALMHVSHKNGLAMIVSGSRQAEIVYVDSEEKNDEPAISFLDD